MLNYEKKYYKYKQKYLQLPNQSAGSVPCNTITFSTLSGNIIATWNDDILFDENNIKKDEFKKKLDNELAELKILINERFNDDIDFVIVSNDTHLYSNLYQWNDIDFRNIPSISKNLNIIYIAPVIYNGASMKINEFLTTIIIPIQTKAEYDTNLLKEIYDSKILENEDFIILCSQKLDDLQINMLVSSFFTTYPNINEGKPYINKLFKYFDISFKSLPDIFKDDEDIVKLALFAYGNNLMWVSDRLKDSKEIVKNAVKQNKNSIIWASARLQEDSELLKLADLSGI